MKKKPKVAIAILTAFILTIIVSSIGYYVFAAEPTTPTFTLEVENLDKDNYGLKEYITIKCKLNISQYQISNDFDVYQGFKMVFNNSNIISNVKEENGKKIAIDEKTIEKGKIIYCEKEGLISNKVLVGEMDPETKITIVKASTIKFDLTIKVNEFAQGITSMNITNSIFQGAKLNFINNAGQFSLDFPTAETEKVNLTVNDSGDYVPNISASYVSATPEESVLDEKVNVKYKINAEEFEPPVINNAGRETIIVLENTIQNTCGGSGISTIMNGLVNDIFLGADRRADDKLGLITCGMGPAKEAKDGQPKVVTVAKIAPSQGDYTDEYGTSVSKITPEDAAAADNNNNKLKFNHELVDRKLFNDFVQEVIKADIPKGPANYGGKQYGYDDHIPVSLEQSFWTSTERDIAGGIKAAIDLLNAKGDPTCSKNIIFVGSGKITETEKIEIQKLDLKGNNANFYTVQTQPEKIDKNETEYFGDNSLKDLHNSLGGASDSFYRNLKSYNDLQNIFMNMLSVSIAKANPSKYVFDHFTLRFDLGENFGVNPQSATMIDTTLPGYYDKEKIITIPVDKYRLTTTEIDGKFIPSWEKKDANGVFQPASKEEIIIPLDVYPKKVSPPVKIPLTFKENGSTIAYKDIYGKDVVGLIGQPSIVVIDPADPRIHGLDNGLDTDGKIMIEDNTGGQAVSIAGATNATILAYAQVYAKDVSIELTIDPNLMPRITHAPHLYYFRDGKYVDSGVIINTPITTTTDGITKTVFRVNEMLVKPDLSEGNPDPTGWVRGDVVVLKYTVMVPPWDPELQAIEYNNSVEYFRAVQGLEEFKKSEAFIISSADLPDLF